MALMASAAGTAYLNTSHSVTVILDLGQVLPIKRRIERRPPGAGFELVLRGKKRQSAQPANIGAVELIIQKRSAEWRLGSVV